jgi:pimeloyl-ACP methyl ester carboxylesterase
MTIGVPHEVERTQVSAEREKVYFVSGDTQCAALHYPGTNGACVIMAGGFAVTMEPGTERFAERFNAAGFTVLGSLVGRPPLLVPLTGEPGTVALLTTPDALDTGRALNPDNRYPDWQQEVAARSALRVAFYRPGRYASRVRCPLLVLVCDQDQSALAEPAVRAAKRAPRGELVRMPGGHHEPFLSGHDHAAEAELSFLRRHLLDHA